MLSLFFFNDTATTEIYTLSLHDALPICRSRCGLGWPGRRSATTRTGLRTGRRTPRSSATRSEEHTSELQSPCNLVCRLLLEKKNSTTGSDYDPPTDLSHGDCCDPIVMTH